MAEITLEDFAPQGGVTALIRKELEGGRFPHATLIQGGAGTGKKTLARLLAQGLVCRGEHPPCGSCAECRLAAAGEHPNLTILQAGMPIAPGLKKDRTTIPVDDIRELVRICGEHTLSGGRRVALIYGAEDMTPQAQNALLKTLEEPPENTCFLLTTEHPDALLTTVISRCQRISLHPWTERQIAEILIRRGTDRQRAEAAARVAEGSIGRAIADAEDESYWKKRKEWSAQFLGLERHGDILGVSGAWKDRKNEADALFMYLEEQVRSLLKFRLDPRETLISDEIPEKWRQAAGKADLGFFARLNDLIGKARREKDANVNFQAVVEQLLFGMLGEVNRWQR